MNEQTENNNESIKLIKNTKGYGWEIKVFDISIGLKTIDRLSNINTILKERFKSDNGGDEE